MQWSNYDYEEDMNLSKVDTPSTSIRDKYTSRELLTIIRNEINFYKSWTDLCTIALQECPTILFQYDRLCYALGNAFGDHVIKIALNPFMVHCYHPACLNTNKPPIKMDALNCIHVYIEHLDRHNDPIGLAMQKRFSAVYDDIFVNMDNLRSLSVSPFSLMDSLLNPSPQTRCVMCSNVYTSFVYSTLNADDCMSSLNAVVKLANICEACLVSSLQNCSYKKLDEKCGNCLSKGYHCRSLNVFHILWDMGSSHKKSGRLIAEKLDPISTEFEFMSSGKFTIGFGALHLSKCVTNGSQNHVLSLNGENYGIHVLRSMKNQNDEAADILSHIKTAVFVGKDRQSDYLSYMSSSKIVQDALIVKKMYTVTRSPEPILTHTENARKQQAIVYPVCVVCNSNGDVFILDAGAACIHAVDRSTVAKTFVVGEYGKPNLNNYSQAQAGPLKLKGKDAKFGDCLSSMVMMDNNLYISDASREEIIILRNCVLAKTFQQTILHVSKSSKCISLSVCNESLLMLTLSPEQKIEIVDIALPSLRKYSLFLHKKVLKTITPSYSIKGLFSATIGNVISFGALTMEKKVLFYVGKKNFVEQMSSTSSAIVPCTTTNGRLVTLPLGSEKLAVYNLHINSSDKSIVYNITSDTFDNKCVPLAVTSWGNTMQIVGKENTTYKLEECGSLAFGLRFCQALNLYYHAITYLPPHGIKDIQKRSMEDCISEAGILSKLLKEMQDEKEVSCPTRSSFIGTDGNLFTETVQCFNDTIEGWETLVKRLNFLDESLLQNVYSHVITNESLIEHSFGFVVLKSRKQLQNMYEYIHNKSKHELDFQMRMTKLPFNQYSKVKLRDKGYQHLDPSFHSKLDMEDFWEVFREPDKENQKNVISEDDQQILRQAFLLTKSVPRRSNRSKWKEESGFQPNLLAEKLDDGTLFPGDLVFCRSLRKILYLQVKRKTPLVNINAIVDVKILNVAGEVVTVKDLVVDQGLIFAVPSALYEVNDEGVSFSDAISQSVEDVFHQIDQEERIYSDEEMYVLPNISTEMVEPAQIVEEPILMETMEPADMLEERTESTSSEKPITSRKRKIQMVSDDPVNVDMDLITPINNAFYIVKLMSKRNIQHFVAQANSSENVGELFWMDFMRKTDVVVDFVWPLSSDDGLLVTSEEIVTALSNPANELTSSSRSGKLTFDIEELKLYLNTLQ